MNKNCYECKRFLTFDEIAMNRKMISPDVPEFLCLSCLSKRYKISENTLKEKIDYLKKSGCTLFSAPTEPDGKK